MECESERIRPATVRAWRLVAQRKTKSDAGFSTTGPDVLSSASGAEAQPLVILPPEGNIAAIDFGTTYCSLAYTTEGDEGASCLRLEGYYARVPNAILLKKSDTSDRGDHAINWEIKAFGSRAQVVYASSRSEDADKYLYFERVKMNLQHDQV